MDKGLHNRAKRQIPEIIRRKQINAFKGWIIIPDGINYRSFFIKRVSR